MPPGGQKRKRGDANYVSDRQDPPQRPSPHRPQNLGLAQQGHQQPQAYRGGPSRRGSGARGGRGGYAHHDGRNAGTVPNGPQPARDAPTTRPMNPTPTNKPVAAVQPTPPPPVATPAAPAGAHVRPNKPSETVLPSFYKYDYLTDERIQAWQESGRQEVLESAVKELQEDSVLDLLFLELIRAALTERLPAKDVGGLVKDILTSEAANGHEDLAETFLDNVSIAFPPPQANKADAAANEIPNPPALRDLLISANIPPNLLRNQLDASVLIACGFVRDIFSGKGIRHTTDELYRQRAYNLLREESEGYAKLLTEYFDASSRPATSDMVADTYQRVMSLIGTFDLDPGRVLDVTLDAFANTIIRHNRFFVKYLRASSWWPVEAVRTSSKSPSKLISALPIWAKPDYVEPENTEEEAVQIQDLRQQRDRAFWKHLEENGVRAWFDLGDAVGTHEAATSSTVTNWFGDIGESPSKGNTIAAQLLGFKLRFYSSNTRDPTDTLPDVLMNLAALLIKIGFISLRDLFPHLYPSTEEEIAKIKAKLQEDKAERERKAKPGGGTNALLAAGALTDDTVPPPGPPRLRDATGNSTPRSNVVGVDADKAKEEAKKTLPDPENQVVVLLRNLLLIGAIPESLFLLGKFPWFMDLYPDLPQYIHRLFHHMLSKVYEPLQPLRDRSSLRAAKSLVDNDKAGLTKGHLSITQPEPRKALRWARLEQTNMEGKDYIFYWDDWADSVPICQTVDDVFLLCNTLINMSGVKIGQDPALLTKLARIGKHSLSTDTSPENTKRWTEISKRLLVPALSLTKSNSPVVNEVFGILSMWPITARFNIYAEWTTGQISRLPDIVAAVEHARAQTKDVLKRISKTNTRPMARELAKIADSNPGTVFREAFRQIESYQNMIEVFVECARYLPALGYDVLTWSLMSSLGGNNRSRNQEDGMLTSPWLQALSEFAGSVFKRYPEMHAQSVLQYVAWQLKEGNSTDLVVLELIIDKLAGIQCDVQMNDYQLQAITGGPLLNKLVVDQLQDKRGDASFRPSTRRLLNALRQTDDGRSSQLVMLVLVLMAQEVTVFPSRDEVKNAPLKVLGINLDRIYNIFNQYLELLRHNLTIEDFDAQIPDVNELIEQYSIEPETAWKIGRPSIQKRIAEIEWPPASKVNGNKVDKKEGLDVEMAETSVSQTDGPADTDGQVEEADAMQTEDSSNIKAGTEKVDKMDTDATAINGSDEVLNIQPTPAMDATSTNPAASPVPPSIDLVHPVLRPYVSRFQNILPQEVLQHLPVAFYVAFWQLQLGDIFVPESAYKDERTRSLKAYEASLKKPMPRTGPLRDAKLKQDTDLKKVFEAWEQESKAEEARCNVIKTRLRYEKELWFYDYRSNEAHLSLHKALWQDCFFPRILQSGADAHYTFHMMVFLHNSGGTYGKSSDGTLQLAEPVFGFRFARLLDDIFQGNALTNMISALTNREAENFGRFFFKLLDKLHNWHKDKATFEHEAYGKDRNLIGFTRKVINDKDQVKTFMTWDEFRTILAKWNSAMFYALKSCLQSKEYMHIRNAILILKQINPPFPAINFHNSQLKSMLLSLHEKDPRPDVRLTAMSCVGDLTKREKYMVSIQVFKGEPESSKSAQRASAIARTSTPQSAATTKSLNAAASEFKPTANGIKAVGAKAEDDDEEGEIDESKKAEEEKKAAAMAAIASAREKKSEEPAKEDATAATTTTTTAASKPATPAPMSDARVPPQANAPQTTSSIEATRQAASVKISSPTPRMEPNGSTASRPTPTSASRPESRAQNDRSSTRPSERDRPEYGRLDRPSELVREDRRARSSSRRSRSKSPERAPPSYRDRTESGHGSSSRDGRDQPEIRSRYERSERLPPTISTPRDRRTEDYRHAQQDTTPSRPTGQVSAPGPHPDRAAMIDPTRAALIHGNERGSASQHARPPLQDEREAFAQRNSRAQEPPQPERVTQSERRSRRQSPQAEERLPRTDPSRSSRRDERQERQPPFPASHRDARDTIAESAPTGPRDPQRAPRDLFLQTAPLPRAPADHNHGRLSQDFGVPPRPSDPNYGRLNSNGPSTLTSDVPSGPRGRNAALRGNRNFNPPGGHGTGPDASSNPASPTYERGPPAGPSFRDRGGCDHNRRGSRDHVTAAPRSNPPSMPPTPTGDRPPSGSSAEAMGVHPSRLQMIDAKPAPLQTGSLPSPNAPSSAHINSGPGAPRGPRGAPSPSGPYHSGVSPTSTRAPQQTGPLGFGGNMGPPTPADRDRRADDRRFSGLNTILQQQSPAVDSQDAPFERDRERRERGRDGDRPPRPFDQDSRGELNRSKDEDRGASIRGRASRQGSFQQDKNASMTANGPASSMPLSGPPVGRPNLTQVHPPPNAEYLERSEHDERSSRRRDGERHQSTRSSGRTHGDRMDHRGNEDRSMRSSRGFVNSEQEGRERDTRRSRDEREQGSHRNGERRMNGSVRDRRAG